MKIYKITNLINGKVYIGLTRCSLRKRFNEHGSLAGFKSLIKRAIHKYGKDNFAIEELASVPTLDEANALEIEFIKRFNSVTPNGYNISAGGLALKSIPKSEIHKANISKALKGRIRSASHSHNISKSKKGTPAPNRRPVYGLNTLTGEGIFLSSAHGARKYGFNQAHIRACCLGLRKHHRGYTWQYIDIINERFEIGDLLWAS